MVTDKRIRRRAEMERWIMEYLRRPGSIAADAMTQQFHEEFCQKFGGARKETYWGAQPVREAMRVLSEMAACGKLEVRRVGLGLAWQPGFPRWVRSYSLPRKHSEELKV